MSRRDRDHCFFSGVFFSVVAGLAAFAFQFHDHHFHRIINRRSPADAYPLCCTARRLLLRQRACVFSVGESELSFGVGEEHRNRVGMAVHH